MRSACILLWYGFCKTLTLFQVTQAYWAWQNAAVDQKEKARAVLFYSRLHCFLLLTFYLADAYM